MFFPRALTLAAFLAITGTVTAADWPQFRGPNRDGVSSETGLLKEWPEGGPKLLWTATGVGRGYSHPAIVGGRIYVTGLVDKDGILRCLDANGTLLWEKKYGPEWAGDKPGARSIPTVHEGLVYVTSGMGFVSCLEANTGDVRWSEDMLKRYDGKPCMWGWAESVLIDGNHAIFTPCGKKGSMVAVDRLTGAPVWASKDLGEKSSYCSALMVRYLPAFVCGGIVGSQPTSGPAPPPPAPAPLPPTSMLVTLLGASIVAFSPENGEVLWRHPYKNFRGNHPVTPLYESGHLYVTSGYGKGAIGLEIDPLGLAVKQDWEQPKQDTCHGGIVKVGDFVYGSSHQNTSGWVCVSFLSGKIAWEDKCVGKGGSVIYADGMLYCYSEDGTVGLVKADPKSCQVVSKFKITQGAGEHWTHPAIANGRLYVRHGDVLMCYDIKASK